MSRVLLALIAVAAAQSPPLTLPDISVGEIEVTLQAINYDRTSGREGERRAAAYLESRLKEYGVAYKRHDIRAFLSWPVRAAVHVDGGGLDIGGIAPAFGGSTPDGGVTAELFWLKDPAGNQESGALPAEARGKIVVGQGMVSPESVWRAQRAGAVGLIHVNDDEILHEMIATTIWGTPTSESAVRLPDIPVVSVKKSSGDRLKAGSAGRRVRLVAEVERDWTTIPLVVAEVPGATPDFILVATHLDAWYEGMTDTGGTVASILEMARVAQRTGGLRRGIRFAWWPGHSFGRYAGSTWYADRFWRELDEHCVAYTNLDGAGRRGSRLSSVSAGGWPGLVEYSRQFAESRLRRSPGTSAPRLFRPGRDSDSAFQGLGIPEFSVGIPGPPRGHADVTSSGRIAYWHTREDTLDKLDMKALDLDTRFRLAQILDLATLASLPHTLAPIAASYERALEELAVAARGRFDLRSTRDLAARLRAATEAFDAARPGHADGRATEAVTRRDRLVVRLTHRLNATLYTRAGRFDQDPAAAMPILPLLAGIRDLAALDPASDAYGFLETALIRGRNQVEATLADAIRELCIVDCGL